MRCQKPQICLDAVAVGIASAAFYIALFVAQNSLRGLSLARRLWSSVQSTAAVKTWGRVQRVIANEM